MLLILVGLIVVAHCVITASDVRPASLGVYRLPFSDGTMVKVFDDFSTHRPRGRVDLYAVRGQEPYRVVAAANGRVMTIQDSYGEQQSGRAAALLPQQLCLDRACQRRVDQLFAPSTRLGHTQSGFEGRRHGQGGPIYWR
jgi:hypothetical protein